MRPSWDVDRAMAEEAVVLDVAAAERDEHLAATATVLAARCHVRLTARQRTGPGLSDELVRLRRHLERETADRGAGGRRRVERALEAVRTGRTGGVATDDLARLVDDLRRLEELLREEPPSSAAPSL